MSIYKNKGAKKGYNFSKDERKAKTLNLCMDITKDFEALLKEVCPDYSGRGILSESLNAFMQDFIENPDSYKKVIDYVND